MQSLATRVSSSKIPDSGKNPDLHSQSHDAIRGDFWRNPAGWVAAKTKERTFEHRGLLSRQMEPELSMAEKDFEA
jgi:hypothetical protein